MKRELNHNDFAWLFVLLSAAFFWWLMGHASEPIPLAELAGLRVLPAAMFIGGAFLLMRLFGGWRYRVTTELKANLVAFAIVLASFILGLAHVLAGR